MILFNNKYFYKTKYEKYYVSKDGNVLSTKRKDIIILKHKINKDGYIEYCLFIDGKQYSINGYRLVAETFLPNVLNKPTINHKDGNKFNNTVDNLEWTTWGENNKHRYEVLGFQQPSKIKFNLYENNIFIKQYDSLSELQMDAHYTYVKNVINNEPKYSYMFFERINNKIIVYWNGEIYKTFNNLLEAGNFFNKNSNTISTKINKKKRKIEVFCKKYKIIKQ